MKELILIRHAKSDWANENVKDIDRPLNERGYGDAYILGKWYKEEMGFPDQILSSPATRALSTAFIFARIFGIREKDVQLDETLYESDVKSYLKSISGVSNKVNRLMVFGHNPTLTSVANELNKDILFDNIPTCGIVKIGFEFNDWKAIMDKPEGKLLLNKFPKSFKQ